MSDTDYYQRSEDNVVDFEAQRAEMGLLGIGNNNAQKAARAFKLSQATGLNPVGVMEDMEEVDNRYRAKVGSQIATHDDYIKAYLNSHPLAPTISQNDLGNMAETSKQLSEWKARNSGNAWQGLIDAYRNGSGLAAVYRHKWGRHLLPGGTLLGAGEAILEGTKDNTTARALAMRYYRDIESSIAGGIAGATTPIGMTGFQGAGKRMIASSEEIMKEALGEEKYKEFKKIGEETVLGEVAGMAGSMTAAIPAFLVGGTWGGASMFGFINAEDMRSRAEELGEDQVAPYLGGLAIGTAFGVIPFHFMTKGIGAKAPGVIPWSVAKLKQAGILSSSMAITNEFQALTNENFARILFDPEAEYHFESKRFLASMIFGGILGGGFSKVKPYVNAGKDIPPGIDPTVDQTKKWQAIDDGKRAKELLKTVQEDETRALDPDFYEQNFLEQHGDSNIQINIEAVRALYGEKKPERGDGILGDVLPDPDRAFGAAEVGGYIEIPYNTWLAKVDPKVANALHDDIVYREGGVSINEAKALDEWHKAVEEARKEAEKDLKPKKAEEVLEQRPAPPKEVKVQKVNDLTDPKTGERVVYFNILDENGANAGFASIAYNKGVVYVEGIGASTRFGKTAKDRAWAFGLANVKSIFEQIKKEFPEATKLGGDRVTGARKKAGTIGEVERDFSLPQFEKLVKERFPEEPDERLSGDPLATPPEAVTKNLPEGEGYYTYEAAQGIWVSLRPTELYTKAQKALVDFITREIDRMSGRTVNISETFGIEYTGADETLATMGLYVKFAADQNELPIILYSLLSKDPLGTARHEVMHHLYRRGFFTEAEWDIMTNAAEAGGWIKKHDVANRYKDADYAYQLEEAIVEEFANWGRTRKPGHPAATPFEKMRVFFAKVRAQMKELFEIENITADDLFARVETGEIGAREPVNFYGEFMQNVQSVRRQAGIETAAQHMEEPFKQPKAIGLTHEESRKVLGLWRRRVKEDQKASQKAAAEEIEKKNSAEWKRREIEMRAEVSNDMQRRPDILADEFIRDGHKLDADKLTDEQKKALPEKYYGKGGIDPEALVRATGYQSLEAMVNNLALLINKRGNVSPKEFLQNEIDAQTAKRMERRYGTPKDEAMKAAEDHVLSDTQMDLIHEETLRLGTEAKVGTPITKSQVEGYTRENFDEMPVKTVKSNAFLTLAGKAERVIRMALMDKNYSEAYRTHQQKQYLLYYAKYAKELEKTVTAALKLARRFSKRDVEGIDPLYAAHIQSILDRFGFKLRDGTKDFEDRIEAHTKGRYGDTANTDLETFVKKAFAGEPDPPVADWLYNKANDKPAGDLTAGEFAELVGSLKALAKVGGDFNKLRIGFEVRDLDKTIITMRDIIKEVGSRDEYRIDIEDGILKKGVKYITAWHAVLEAIFNRFDLNNPMGIFNKVLSLPFARAAGQSRNWRLEAAERLRKGSKPTKGYFRSIDNPWVREIRPDDDNTPVPGNLMKLTKGNLLAIVQNMGNPDNWYGFLDGYHIPREKSPEVMKWIFDNITKDDMDNAKNIGNVFDWAFQKAVETRVRMYENPPKKVPTWVIKTPWGDYEGWYHPKVYDPAQAQNSKAMTEILDTFYNRGNPKPSANYAKARTGYTGAYLLDMDVVQSKLAEILHDAAVKEVVHEGAKVMLDNRFKDALSRHYGPQYADLLKPFLEDVAGLVDNNTEAQRLASQVVQFIRTNVISHYVGLNLGTFLKHSGTALAHSVALVGVKQFSQYSDRFIAGMYRNDSLGQFILAHSKEVPGRHTAWRDTIRGSFEETYGRFSTKMNPKEWLEVFENRPLKEGGRFLWEKTKMHYLGGRENMMWIYGHPLAWFDLKTAEITWAATYFPLMEKGKYTHNEAVDMADRAVRRTHSSTLVTSRPAALRGNALTMTFASFYAFFNHMLMRDYETAWAMKELSKGGKYYVGPDEFIGKGDKHKPWTTSVAFRVGMSAIPVLTTSIIWYHLGPAIWDAIVAGHMKEKDEDDPWALWLLKEQARFEASKMLGIRDIAHWVFGGGDFGSGLLGEFVKSQGKVYRDVVGGWPEDIARQQKYIKDANTAFATAYGLLPPRPVVRSGMFYYNWAQGDEEVESFGDWFYGHMHGTTKPRRHH